MKPNLKDITLIIVDCVDLQRAKLAFDHCLACCDFGDAKFISHFDNVSGSAVVTIPRLTSVNAYSVFMVKELANHFQTPHALVIQWDGFIRDPNKWTDEFLNYDYIGAPWPEELLGPGVPKNFVVGNGGFSLRSKRLQDFLRDDPRVTMLNNREDVLICQVLRPLLEAQGCKFAPLGVAQQFAFESDPITDSFGVHQRIKLVRG